MPQPRFTHWMLLCLFIGAVLLPISICVALAVAAVLGGMGDLSGESALRGVAIAAGVVWAIDLISLVLVVALESLANRDRNDHNEEP